MDFKPSYFQGNSDNPVEQVTWYDALIYCNKLSEVAGLDKNFNIRDIEYDGKGTMPVGQKRPNELGLYDMSGNVWDWTNTGRPNIRIFRGGSWNYRAIGVRRIYRNHPYKKSNYRGFRIARTK